MFGNKTTKAMDLLSQEVVTKFHAFGYRILINKSNDKVILYYEGEDYQFSVTYHDFEKEIKTDNSFENIQRLFFKAIVL